MVYVIDTAATVDADPASIWQAWTDIARVPEWDTREEEGRLEGPFAVGTTIWSKQKGTRGGRLTLIAVEPQRRWTVMKPLPAGKLVIHHVITPQADSRVRVSKRYEVTGPLVLLFRLIFGPRVRREMPASFAALEREAQRLAAQR